MGKMFFMSLNMLYNEVVGFDIICKCYVGYLFVRTCFGGRIVHVVLLVEKVLMEWVVV